MIGDGRGWSVVVPLAVALLGTAAPAQATPTFRVTAIDGRVLAGTLSFDDGTIHLVGTGDQRSDLALADVLSIAPTSAPSVAADAPFCVWLRSGTQLPARRVDGAPATTGREAQWTIETVGGTELAIAQTAIAAVRSRPVAPESFATDRRTPDDNSDWLYVVKDGKPQRFRVTVKGLREGRVHFDLGAQSFDFPMSGADSVAAIVFGKNTGFAPDPSGSPRVTATFATGEQCAGKLERIDANVTLLLDEGARFAAPLERLLTLEVQSDKLAWLSALEPRVEQTAAFDRKWPWTRDSSPAGPGIILGGRVHSRGLVLVPRTRLTYALAGRFDLFEATIGIDERGGPQAHAILRVYADDKLLFESPPLQLGSPPQSLRLELGHCQQLVLEADFGKNFDLGDLCAFADARVTRR